MLNVCVICMARSINAWLGKAESSSSSCILLVPLLFVWGIHFQKQLAWAHCNSYVCLGWMWALWAEVVCVNWMKHLNEQSIHVWQLWQLVHPTADSMEPTKWEQRVGLKAVVSSHTQTIHFCHCTSDSSAYFIFVFLVVNTVLVGTLIYLAAMWEQETELHSSLIIRPEPSNHKPASGNKRRRCRQKKVFCFFVFLYTSQFWDLGLLGQGVC